MDMTVIGIIGIIVLIVLLFLGMNVGFSMLAVGFVGFVVAMSQNAALATIKTVPFNTVANFNLSIIPLFVLMGQFCFHSGVSTDLFQTCYKWFNRFSGGLAVSTIGASMLFSALCGSSPATVATMGTVCHPEMKRYGYKDALSTGSIAAGGTLGILIPPSVGFILYGIATGNSIGALFAAGLFPGIILGFMYMGCVVLMCKNDPTLAPMNDERFSWIEKFKSLKGVIFVVILFVVVIGGIFAGIFTANEGAAIGAFGSFLILLFRRKLTLKVLLASLHGTVSTTAMTFLILIGAYVFNIFLAFTQIPQAVARAASAMDVHNYVILIIFLLVFIVLGLVFDSIAMLLLLVPIFYPLILDMGMDPIWFGVLMVMCMECGQITPPVGINVFVIKGIAKEVPLQTIFRGVFPFFLTLLVAIVIMVTFPQISLSLPYFLYPPLA